VQLLARYEAERQFVDVITEYGTVQVKIKLLDGEIIQVSPEYEDCKRLATRKGVPLKDIFEEAKRAAWTLLERKMQSNVP